MIIRKSLVILASAGLCWSLALNPTLAQTSTDSQGFQVQTSSDNAQTGGGVGWQTQSFSEENASSNGENTGSIKTDAQQPKVITNPNDGGFESEVKVEIDSVKPKAAQKPKRKPKKPVNAEYAKANRMSVSIISSTIDNSALLMANDLASLLDNKRTLRVVPIVGKGTAQSLKDLYYLKGVDIGIIQSDVLHHYKKNKKLPDPGRFIRYISTLGTQEVHVVARRQYKTLKDLQGKSVNIGPSDGGNAITAKAVFKAHGITINTVHLANKAAVRRLMNGDIDAVVMVGGKPFNSLLSVFASSKDFHLLDVNFNEKLESRYQPTVMIHEEYPYLIKKDQVVSSVAVDMVVAMYYWPKGTTRYKKVARFVDAFFSQLHRLQKPLYHSKWKEVNPYRTLKGWKRFRAAKEWLQKNKKKNGRYSSLPFRQY